MAVAEAAPGLLFDETRNRRLAEIYAPCFTLILQLRGSREFGDADVLRRRIKDLFDQAEREAMRAGISGEEIRNARFALVAFIDETVLSSDWSQKDRWVARPLQLELYERYDAGEVFFDRLQELLQQPGVHAEVLEVYYLCMTLGFKGRYQLHEQERLRILIEECFAALNRAPGMQAAQLAPHGRPRGQVAAEVRSKIPAWAIAAAAAGLALLIYIGMTFYVSGVADRTVQTIEQVPHQTPP
ncbi:type IVB secretion system protein IcmH/DotU [Rhodocaloribacter litoris]|uniref:type IVB secretion system protein IcmH/DotU n=1 Tax=Rhodocaloribacter litoris TaxID=2558931 RepID=UPI0014238FA9|nr:type IVB secretion system protein IcmH/DotU [Rhodocaloribacter litoris]QXD13866.1 type IVB secretion system protein IcmH/DotU [Rhodocaloribacter litoris]